MVNKEDDRHKGITEDLHTSSDALIFVPVRPGTRNNETDTGHISQRKKNEEWRDGH